MALTLKETQIGDFTVKLRERETHERHLATQYAVQTYEGRSPDWGHGWQGFSDDLPYMLRKFDAVVEEVALAQRIAV